MQAIWYKCLILYVMQMHMFMYYACFQAAEEQVPRNLKRGSVSTDKPEEESHNSGEEL